MRTRWERGAWLAAASWLCLCGFCAGQPAEEKPRPEETAPAKPTAPPAIFAHCRDGSVLRITVRDERLEMTTPYGKLQIPAGDIQRIELATRLPDETTRSAEAAIAALGKPDFKTREAAAAQLLVLQDRAYPALLKAAKHADPEVARRVNDLLEKIRAAVPAERLEVRANDVVHTHDSKITGRLAPTALRVATVPFGEQSLKLSDLLEIASRTTDGPSNDENALPDPGALHEYQGHVGKTLSFRVTGGAMPQLAQLGFRLGGFGGAPPLGAVWGTDVYTLDSALSAAAVHAGILKMGQTGVVKVTILGPQLKFTGSNRNGVMSLDFGPFPGAFRVTR